ncbi:MAG: Na+:solute symporter [bacterium]|nr:Na+:solute symporter [bacterium]
MQLHALDWTIIAGYLVLALAIGLMFRKRAGSNAEEYFASGRSLPWWIAGTSMVATTFAADTPLWVTGKVAQYGVAGNWLWWAFAFGGMLTVFVFARLWRRAEVLTDVELIELRYTGGPARFLRGFRAIYVAVIMQSLIIGWVTVAMARVLKQTVLFDPNNGDSGLTDGWIIGLLLAITGVYSVLAGMWGVVVADMVQFVLAMVGCTVFAIIAVDHVGGTAELQNKVNANFGSTEAFSLLPDFSAADPWMPVSVFLALVFCQWWASWYPGAEPGGGGYIVQRMASCKDEKHAVKATLFFQLMHYCVRPWPWILVAFAALALHPEVREWATAENPAGNPEDAYPALIRELAPIGLRGLLLVTFAAAAMSTISTQMNLGASYLVTDVYKRFVNPSADDRTMVRASKFASVLILVLGGGVSFFLIYSGAKIDDAWQLLLALGAGVGAVFILRWFWWRINAWSEIAAMIGSIAFYVLVTRWEPTADLPTEFRSLIVALLTLVLWLAVTFVTRPESQDHLVAFYRKVRPDGPGWGPVARDASEVRPDGQLGRGILCAILGTATIWLTLPGIGAVIFGETTTAIGCLGGAVVSGGLMFFVFSRSPAMSRT